MTTPADRATARPRPEVVLRALRDARGLTQQGWAALLGYSVATVRRWESGTALPNAETQEALIAACAQWGLFRTFSQGPLGGVTLTPDLLRDLLAEARLGSRYVAEAEVDQQLDQGVLPSPSPKQAFGLQSQPEAEHPHNLPVTLTSFVGREHELDEVKRLLLAARLVTLTGSGGAGKTRLAIRVVSGEADTVFAELVQRVMSGQDVSDLPGVRTRRRIDSKGVHETAPQAVDMDALPFPDFDDFFRQAPASYSPHLLFESSRGCWWGEKHQCTFCGLNGLTMNYRSKSITRAVDELEYLTARYPSELVFAVDNILNMRYFNGFFEELARRDIRLDLVYEVKANLKKAQLRQLRSAGVRQIQPGIESLSDAVLACMRKGVKGLHNVQLLKWCQELGIAPFWNMLWGFPDEPAEEYRRMAAMVPLIEHLPPPAEAGPIRLDRFSPNFDQAAEHGLIDVQPYPAYRHVFALPDQSLAQLAYYFTYRYRDWRDPEAYTRDFRQAVHTWRAAYPSSYLFFFDEGDRLLVWDFRQVARKPLTLISGFARELYLACDGVRAPSQLPVGAEQALESLVEQGLMLRDGGAYLSLAIPVGDYVPPPAAICRVDDVLRQATERIAAW